MDVAEAFQLARKHAVSHMGACERAQLRWGETSITEIVTAQAARAVSVVPFSQNAEVLSGADWIWWWVDGASAYGMLVQAKRVTVTKSTWSFGFDYRSKKAVRAQRDVLLSTAATLDLVPVYALYLGTGDYRGWAPCPGVHKSGRCLGCTKRAVSLMPALLADSSLVTDASSTYEKSVALEDMWTPPLPGSPVIKAIERELPRPLAEFLLEPQWGTRAVARSMIDVVLRTRQGMFGPAVTTLAAVHNAGAHDLLGPVFDEYPEDAMHGGMRYFPHMLAPLRHAPPSYVAAIIAGDIDVGGLAESLPDNVAGVVVVPVPDARAATH